jgi:hypothetical protein
MQATPQHIKYYRPITTDEVMKYLKISEEEVFNIRVDVGMEYCHSQYGKFANQFYTNFGFWAWFLRIWEINDKYFMDQVRQGVKLKLRDYRKTHAFRCLKFNMSKQVEVKFTPPTYSK